MMCLPSRCLVSPLSPNVSHCLPACVPVLDGASAFPRSCLPFSIKPIVSSPHMCACDGMSAFSGLFLSAIVCHCLSPHVCLCWMVCPPSRGLVPPCLPLAPHDGVSAFPRSCFPVSSSIVSHLPSCFFFLDGVPAFSGSGLPWSPIVSHSLPSSPHMCAFVGWCVRLPEVLSPIVSHCVLTWCVRLPDVLSPNCLPLSPHVCLCWMVCPPSRGLVSSHCLPTRVLVLDVVSAFPRSCFLLSPIVSPHVCLCWMVRPLSGGLVSLLSPIVSLLVSLCWEGVPAFLRFCLPCLLACLPACLPSCLPASLPTCLSSCFPLWRVVWFCFFFLNQCAVRGS